MRRPRVHLILGVVAVIALLAVGAVSAFAIASGERAHRAARARVADVRSVGGRPTTASNRRSAIRDAADLLGVVVAPPGATRRSGGVATYPHAQLLTGALASAIAHRSWTSSRSPSTVLATVVSHLPRIARLDGTGSSGPDPISSSRTYAWPSIPGHLGVRWLQITVTTRAGGGTLLRAVAQSQWIVVRPRGERVPAGVTDVTITDGVPRRRPLRTVETRDPSTIRALIRLVDDREILQPTVINCASEPVDPPIVTIDFRGPRGAALTRVTTIASARYSFPSTEPGWACFPVDVVVRGRAEPALPGDIVTPVQRLLHVSLPAG